MSFDVNVLSSKPVIKAAANMQNDGGAGNLGYMSQGRKEHEESAGRISALTTQVSELTDKLSTLTEQLRKNNESLSAMTEQVLGLMKQLREKDEKIAELQSTVKVGKRNFFGRKSQKGAQS